MSHVKTLIQVGGDNAYHNNIKDAVNFMTNIPNDVTIISGDNEEIESNKYILSLFSPILRSALSNSSTLLLPDCSSLSIRYLLNIINTGFSVTEKLSNGHVIEIIRTAKLLSIEIKLLYHDENITPSLAKSKKVSSRIKSKKSMNIPKNRNEESIINVMDNLIQIFDPDYKDEEDVVTEETFSILNVPQENVRGTKRKRNNIPVSKNDGGGKYPCEQCDYEYKDVGMLKKHVESVHEEVRYPCNECDYKATQAANLKRSYFNIIHSPSP